MNTEKTISKGRLWTSYILQGIIILLMGMGAISNLMMTEQAVTGAVEFGFYEGHVHYLGMVLLVAVLLFAIPKTNVLGAILLTGWLGGAVATHLIHSDSVMFLVFPLIFGTLIWLSIGLRSAKLMSLLPFVK